MTIVEPDVIKLPSFKNTDIFQIFQLMTTKPIPLSTTKERNNLANAGKHLVHHSHISDSKLLKRELKKYFYLWTECFLS